MKFNGEGIQHIALRADDLLATIDSLIAARRAADDGAATTIYYEMLDSGCRATARMSASCRRAASCSTAKATRGRRAGCCCRSSRRRRRAGVLRVHPAQGRRRFRRRQLQGAVRVDRARPGAPRRAVAGRGEVRHGARRGQKAAVQKKRARLAAGRKCGRLGVNGVTGACKARLALCRLGRRHFALNEPCPQQGASLSDGCVVNGLIECPVHYGLFDVRTGARRRRGHDEPRRTLPARSSRRVSTWIYRPEESAVEADFRPRHRPGPCRAAADDAGLHVGFGNGSKPRRCRGAADRPQLAAEMRLRAVCRAAERIALHRASREQRAHVAVPHSATVSTRRVRPGRIWDSRTPRRATKWN